MEEWRLFVFGVCAVVWEGCSDCRELAMDEAILEILVCPITRSKLRREGDFLVSEVGGVRYPIKEGLAVLLPEAGVLPEGVRVEELRAGAGKRGNDE